METPDPAPGVEAGGQALVPGKKRYAQEDPLVVDRRRREVARLRYVEHRTEHEIVKALSELAEPLQVSQSTVSRDLHLIRRKFRHYLSVRGFDPADEVYARLAAYQERESIAMECVRAIAKTPGNGAEIATLIRAANDASKLATDLLQDVGVLGRRLGTLVLDDGQKTNRIPSGSELQKRFDSILVTDGEIISEAEIAWKYGDAAQAEAAAKAATDTARDDPHAAD